MSFIARSTVSNRAFGFLSSFTVHAGLGLALLVWQQQSGPTGASPSTDEGRHLVAIELQALPDGEVEARTDQHAQAQAAAGQSGNQTPEPKTPQPARNGMLQGGGQGSGNGLAEAGEGTAASSSAAEGAPRLSGNDIELFKTTLLRHIERFRRYPEPARKAGLEGTAQVHFVMTRAGGVADIWIEMGSGAAVLDEEAVEAVLRARPLPVPPQGWPDSFDVTLPIGYVLK